MTSNRPIEDWGKLLGDVPAASAILDRLLSRADIIPVTGRSHRLAQKISERECRSARHDKPMAEGPYCTVHFCVAARRCAY